jgi:hypothetical protein
MAQPISVILIPEKYTNSIACFGEYTKWRQWLIIFYFRSNCHWALQNVPCVGTLKCTPLPADLV